MNKRWQGWPKARQRWGVTLAWLLLAWGAGMAQPVAAAAGTAETAAGTEVPLPVVQIAPGVYCHAGLPLGIEAPGRADIANLGFIVGERAVAVVDTGGSVAVGRRLLAAVRRVTALPVAYVINTHVHFDHLLGNAAFRGKGTQAVGHAGLAAALAEGQGYFREHFAAELAGEPPERTLAAPGIAVAVGRPLALDLGGRRLTLTAFAPAHTRTDLTVLDGQSGTLFAGDLVAAQRTPALDASLKGWLAALDLLQALPAARVVPGHGPASLPWPAGAAATRRYLETLAREVGDAIAAGRPLERAMDEVGRGERAHWLLFDEHHRRNVSRAYAELEWE
jgi:quinoprotein relay system zinc metallohydrolase 2